MKTVIEKFYTLAESYEEEIFWSRMELNHVKIGRRLNCIVYQM